MTSRDAIADPVRLGVVRYLGAHRSAPAREVAAGIGIHLNTARAHLAALERADVVERASESGGRPGRPVVRYRLRHGWAPNGEELLPMARLLSDAVRGAGSEARLRRLGREWGLQWAAAPARGSAEESLTAALSRLAFRAKVSDGRLVVSACPCPLVSPGRPELICGLADAVCDGVLEGSGLEAATRKHDPDARRCSTTLRVR
jgi:predicted ArsR family transcriptional regulator